MISDLRFALRQLAKSPGFTAIAVLTLALGIGANTAIFSVINSALLQPLRYPEPHQLVEIWSRVPSGTRLRAITGPQFKQLRDHASSYASISILHPVAFNLIERGHADRIRGLEVNANFLRTLRIDPLLGADFDPQADAVGGASNVVLLTYEWWQSRFGGDRAIVGRTINFNQTSHTIVGVLPPDALTRDDVQFLVPLVLDAQPWRLVADNPWAPVLARLKPGVSLAQAEGETGAIVRELQARLLPDRPANRPPVVRPMQEVIIADSRPTLLILLGAVALVLLIACANVANLLLVRATGRQREMAVRAALGATSGRIVRQLLTESVVLAMLGGIGGVFIASIGEDLLGRTIVATLPHAMQPTVDLRVLGFSLALAAGTGLLFGLFPALRARRMDLTRDLKESSRATAGSRSRVQSVLIVAEVALTLVLLIGAGLLLRSFGRLMTADLGFNPKQALVCDMALTLGKFPSSDATVQFYREAVQRLEALPGVEAVGTTTTLPLSNEGWGGRIGRSETPISEHTNATGVDFVSGHYFEAMGISLLRGRALGDDDNRLDAPRVAVINDILAANILPDVDPIGRRVRFRGIDYEIVGLVGAIRQRRVEDTPGSRIYLPHVIDPNTVRFVIRTRVAPLSIAEDVKRTLAALDPDQSISHVRTLEQAVSGALQERRVALSLIGIFAAIALSLACLGIYGVMAYTISQRARELSIRMALGAERSDVIRFVLRDGLRLGLIGVVAGLLGGAAGAQLIASRLYEISPYDPLVFALSAAVIAVVATLSVYFPARRAARIDALLALRTE